MLTLNDVAPGEPATPAGGDGPRAGQPVRRTFTAAYKLRIVEEYFSLTERGARGALLRREGLYQSHLEKWRRALDRGNTCIDTGTWSCRAGRARGCAVGG